MPPKKSKKVAEKEKKKYVEDKTFGLKNKNKSKKVQKYIKTVQQQAQQKIDGPRKRGESRAASSAAADGRKAMLAARMAELKLISQPVKEKVKKLSPEEEERIRKEKEEEEERIRIASLPVEDQIEAEREKLKTRTPVTLERFLAWKKVKDEERRKRKEIEKKEAQKGLSKSQIARGQGLTGRDLFQFDSSIFQDDEEADDEVYKPVDNPDSEDHKELDEREEYGNAVDEDLNGAVDEPVGVGDESLFS